MNGEWIEKEAKAYLNSVRREILGIEPHELSRSVLDLVKKNEAWIDNECVNLYAATNLMSPLVRRLLSSSIATRVAEGHVGAKHQRGIKYLERIEAYAIELTKRLFKAEFAECRVLSGSMANNIIFSALTEPGDTILSLNVPSGGHISYQRFGVAGLRRLKIRELPFDNERLNVDVEKLKRVAEEVKPKLIVLGASLILFPYPIEEIRRTADQVGASIHYDGAHVLGLIAGGKFQDPLTEGADSLSGSTYKTFAGPPGGLILCNSEDLAEKIDKATFPGMTANIHYNRLAGLVIATLELLEFGEDYASQTVSNAKALAKHLYNLGFNVLGRDYGFTQSHQIAVDASNIGGGKKASLILEKANIICNPNLLPGDSLKTIHNPRGLRLGVQEVTRLGMREKEMKQIAGFMKRVLIDSEPPERIREEVIEFRKEYQKVHYCFETM